MLNDDGRPSSDKAISVCDDDGLPAIDWDAGRLNLCFSFRLLLSYLCLTINFLCHVSVCYGLCLLMSISCRQYLWLNVLLCSCLSLVSVFRLNFFLPSIFPLSTLCLLSYVHVIVYGLKLLFTMYSIYHVLYSTSIRNYNPSTVPEGLCLSLKINKLNATYDLWGRLLASGSLPLVLISLYPVLSD